MKKLLQKIYSYKNLEVTDADSGQKEIAQYQMIFGLVFRVKYIKIEPIPSQQIFEKNISNVLPNVLLKLGVPQN